MFAHIQKPVIVQLFLLPKIWTSECFLIRTKRFCNIIAQNKLQRWHATDFQLTEQLGHFPRNLFFCWNWQFGLIFVVQFSISMVTTSCLKKCEWNVWIISVCTNGEVGQTKNCCLSQPTAQKNIKICSFVFFETRPDLSKLNFRLSDDDRQTLWWGSRSV